MFSGVPSTEGGKLTIEGAGAGRPARAVDSDGDGTPEAVLPPDAVLDDPSLVQDVTMPATTLTVTGDKDEQGKLYRHGHRLAGSAGRRIRRAQGLLFVVGRADLAGVHSPV